MHIAYVYTYIYIYTHIVYVYNQLYNYINTQVNVNPPSLGSLKELVENIRSLCVVDASSSLSLSPP